MKKHSLRGIGANRSQICVPQSTSS